MKGRDNIQLPEIELRQYSLSHGCAIAPKDTVELRDLNHEGESMNSGDFLRVKYVIKNLNTGEVYLRGLRLKRTKYTGQLFNCRFWSGPFHMGADHIAGKLNELAMVLRVPEGDTRCAFVAGLEDVAIEEVLRTRKCVLTNKPYPLLSFRDGERCAFPASFSKKEIKEQIFHGGLLACRMVHVVFISKNGKPYSGIIRHLHAREADPTGTTNDMFVAEQSQAETILLDDDDDNTQERSIRDLSRNMSSLGRRARMNSIDHGPRKRRSPPMPTKHTQYTFGDAFCGGGGGSQGAKQAGLSVRWGMDFDEHAIQAYSENHPGSLPFQWNAHDFPPEGYTCRRLRVDVLHLSPPCCFFSPAKYVLSQWLELQALIVAAPGDTAMEVLMIKRISKLSSQLVQF